MKKCWNVLSGFLGRFMLFSVQIILLCILLTFLSDELLCGCRASGEIWAYYLAMLFSATKTGVFLYAIKRGKSMYTLWEYIESICYCLPGWFFAIQLLYVWSKTDFFAQSNDVFSQVLRLVTMVVLVSSVTLRFVVMMRARVARHGTANEP